MGRSVNRIGFIGGTFDPIHFGHLRMAEEARYNFSLSKVYFLPSRIPPHKLGRKITPPEIRVEMIKKAIRNNPYFGIDTHDLDLDKPSYTVNTLRDLREKYREAEIFFIIGMDSFRELHTWKDFMNLFDLANFLVARRPRYSEIHFRKVEEFFPPFDEEKIRNFEVNFEERRLTFRESGYSIFFYDSTLLDISSSGIRKLVKEGHSIKYLVPEDVREVIIREKLYMEQS